MIFGCCGLSRKIRHPREPDGRVAEMGLDPGKEQQMLGARREHLAGG